MKTTVNQAQAMGNENVNFTLKDLLEIENRLNLEQITKEDLVYLDSLVRNRTGYLLSKIVQAGFKGYDDFINELRKDSIIRRESTGILMGNVMGVIAHLKGYL